MKWVLNEDSAETWEKFSPSNVKALVQGKSIYDPRLESGAAVWDIADKITTQCNAIVTYVKAEPSFMSLSDYLTDS